MKTRITAVMTALLVLSVSAMCATAEELPSAFDWRDVDGVNYVTPVKSQGACGACYAFATIAATELFIRTRGGEEFDLSEEQAKMCSGCGCTSGIPDYVLGLFSITGSVLEADDPYTEYDTECHQNTPAIRITGWEELSYGSRDEIKEHILEYGGVITTVDWHGLTIIGWNDTMELYGYTGFWITKNSYGTAIYDGFFPYPYEYGGIGTHIKSITGFEYYDEDVETIAHTDIGCTYGVGYHPDNTAWGISLLEVGAGQGITKIEFDTTGSTSDVDFYIYDGFDGTSLGTLLYQVTDMSHDVPGFYSIDLDSSLVMDVDTEVAVVGRFVNTGTQPNLNGFRPIAVERLHSSGKTYVSQTGIDGTWTLAETMYPGGGDVTFRLRATDDPTLIGVTTIRRDAITIRGSGFGDESDWSDVIISHEGNPLECGIISWNDDRVVVDCPAADVGDVAAINTLHGSDSATITSR